MQMFEMLNVKRIFQGHIMTLKDYGSERISVRKLLEFFFFLPIPISCVLVLLDKQPTTNLLNALLTSLSIFAALLFNLLLLTYDITQRKSNSMNHELLDLRGKLLKEIYSNISFGILVSLIDVVMCLLTYLIIRFAFLRFAMFFIVYYLVVLFVETLLMILKRVYILLLGEFKPKT